MTITVILGNLSYMLVACSFMVRDMLWLRGLSIMASCCGIFYSSTVAKTPLWTPIVWSCVFIGLNVYHISRLILENRGITFTDKEQELYQTCFSTLSPLEFKKLNDIAEWKQISENEKIIEQGQKMTSLYLIYSGITNVVVDGKKVAELRDGQFIGEMSFMTEGDATATVVSEHPTEYLTWNQEGLKGLMARNPSLLFSLQKSMGTQLSNAIKEGNNQSAA
ncbi:MAG: cyclic nucleotide-binding domain-containing protein [Bacteriovoracaceae bacterium]|nr:cyclic nucleotide-binding domain-containing protein [Bacteriovoracaceae bacterium]